MGATPEIANIDELVNRRLEELLPQKIEEALRQREESKTPSMSIIATKGTLDWAYPPFILGSTAAALGWNVSIFFTFYGLNLLKKDVSDLKISPLGNPGMPMKMPFGPDWFKGINWNIPNIIQAGVPGFESIATMLMAQTIKNNGVATSQSCAIWRWKPMSVHGLPDDRRPVRLQPRRLASRPRIRRRGDVSCRTPDQRTSTCSCSRNTTAVWIGTLTSLDFRSCFSLYL